MFYIQRMIPVTATTSKVENEVYRPKNATDDEFEKINAFYHQVLAEDKDLCDGSQRNINGGVYVNGEYHPEKEKVSTLLWTEIHQHDSDFYTCRDHCIFKTQFGETLLDTGTRNKKERSGRSGRQYRILPVRRGRQGWMRRRSFAQGWRLKPS